MGGPWRRNERPKLGQAVHAARDAFGIRQRELARFLGLATATIGKYERGDAVPRGDVKLLLKKFVTRSLEHPSLATIVWNSVVSQGRRDEQLVWLLTGKLSRLGIDKGMVK